MFHKKHLGSNKKSTKELVRNRQKYKSMTWIRRGGRAPGPPTNTHKHTQTCGYTHARTHTHTHTHTCTHTYTLQAIGLSTAFSHPNSFLYLKTALERVVGASTGPSRRAGAHALALRSLSTPKSGKRAPPQELGHSHPPEPLPGSPFVPC